MLISQLVSEKEYIILNDSGIICQKGTRRLWEYQWSDIKELQIGRRFRNPSVEIVPIIACCEKTSKMGEYFQLGVTAKKAIKSYCKCPVRDKGTVLCPNDKKSDNP